MLFLSRFCNILSLKQHVARQILINVILLVTFFYLILFSLFNSLYRISEPREPDHYDIENVTVKPVGCSFPISGYYERTPRYICYLLLVFTVVIRNHKWLAAGAAASMLTYSGVAAIHLIIIFATNDRFNFPKAKLHCESIPIPGGSTSFVACAGVADPDLSLAMTLVSSVMLGALPAVAWSTTFRRSSSKAILLFWLLLLALGHMFYTLSRPNVNNHFQICPKDYIEPLPTGNYKAPFLDQSWRDSFFSLVSTAQKSSQSPRNSSSLACIYSCFATTGYLGRTFQDIIVWDGIAAQHLVIKTDAKNRYASIVFWWAYVVLAFLTLFTTEKKGRLPKGLHKLLFSIEYCQQPLASRWKWKKITNIAVKRTRNSNITTSSSEATTSVTVHITGLKIVQLITQFVTVVAFFGNILARETKNAHKWHALSQEPFVAVGQWSNLAVVLMVLVAAGVGRMWADKEAESTMVEEELGLENAWDWRIGYAS